MTAANNPWAPVFRLADLPGRKPTRFDLRPDDAARAGLAEALGILSLDAARFRGTLSPKGRSDWLLEADLTATVTQPCVVTLAPVTSRIEEETARHYVADYTEPEADEVEIPEDDSIEALPATIDIGAVMLEALTLALPLYPRAENAEIGQAQFAAPGQTPMTDEALRPFAGLADILKKQADKD
ncbi:MAG: DUF177 domain-containing protein [Rhodobacteraceae bacterium]|nr:DUF177 domain-containing protein [Paracoccaceae bacterium]